MKKIIQILSISLFILLLLGACKKKKQNISGTNWERSFAFGKNHLEFKDETKVRAYITDLFGKKTYDQEGTYKYNKPNISISIEGFKPKSGTVDGDKMTLKDNDKFEQHTYIFGKK